MLKFRRCFYYISTIYIYMSIIYYAHACHEQRKVQMNFVSSKTIFPTMYEWMYVRVHVCMYFVPSAKDGSKSSEFVSSCGPTHRSISSQPWVMDMQGLNIFCRWRWPLFSFGEQLTNIQHVTEATATWHRTQGVEGRGGMEVRDISWVMYRKETHTRVDICGT